MLTTTTLFPNPDSTSVRVSGWIDMNDFMVSNGAILVGLLPANDSASHGLNPTSRGAWTYITGNAATEQYRFGPSNGNAGGEIIQGGLFIPRSTDLSSNVFNFEMLIGGGEITFTMGSFSSTRAYTDDFSSGAHFTIDAWSAGGQGYSFDYDFTVQAIPLPGPAMMGLAGLGLLGAVRRRRA